MEADLCRTSCYSYYISSEGYHKLLSENSIHICFDGALNETQLYAKKAAPSPPVHFCYLQLVESNKGNC